MDKSWMTATKWTKKYMEGVDYFMKFAQCKLGSECEIRCPCKGCLNLLFQAQKVVKSHLLQNGIDPGYISWFYHGEASTSTNLGNQSNGNDIEEDDGNDEDTDGVHDMIFELGEKYIQSNELPSDDDNDYISDLPSYLEALVQDAKTELYPGCKKISRVYPPAFFDVMVHLPIHLPEEALLGGPVQFRWMYPIERYLCELKQSVRNKAHPKGCIAEAYVAKECLTFCSMYLHGIETRFNRDDRNNDSGSDDPLSIFSQHCRPLGATKFVELPEKDYNVIQWFVLQNCDEVQPFLEMHKEILLSSDSRNIDETHRRDFPTWFKQQMIHLFKEEPSKLNESLYSLACIPHRCSRKYTGCIVNGVRFMSKERDNRRKSQNSGIVAKGYHGEDVIDFYGVLDDIIQLDYVKDRHVTIFSCDWFDLGRKKQRIQQDGNIVSVNVTRNWYENDSYVLANQASQVFYVNDPKLGRDWRVVLPFQHRHIYDVDEIHDEEMNINNIEAADDEVYQESEIVDGFDVVIDEIPSLNRQDVDHEVIVVSSFSSIHEEDLDNVDEEDEIDDTLVDYCDSDDDSERRKKF
ncbi:hypothetical protein M5689_006503 [Euphorbia peplus]|nr:hypothetical protein M5689_006503 [Euphorbia peplus]